MSTQKQTILKYLPLILSTVVYLIVIGIAWGTLTARTKANADEMHEFKDEQIIQRSDIVEMKIKIERIDTNVQLLLKKID